MLAVRMAPRTLLRPLAVVLLLAVAAPVAAFSLRFHGHGTGFIDRVLIPLDAPARPIDVVGDFTLRYKNKGTTPSGIESVTLKQGLVPGKAQILVRGRGALLDTPPLGALTSPLRVQLVNDGGTCWEAAYSFPPALRSTSAEFKDRAD